MLLRRLVNSPTTLHPIGASGQSGGVSPLCRCRANEDGHFSEPGNHSCPPPVLSPGRRTRELLVSSHLLVASDHFFLYAGLGVGIFAPCSLSIASN